MVLKSFVLKKISEAKIKKILWFFKLNRYVSHLEFCYTFARTKMLIKDIPENILMPPETVSGMQKLNRNAFIKEVEIPSLIVPSNQIKNILPYFKPYLLKMCKLAPIQGNDEKIILINPLILKEKHKEIENLIQNMNINEISWKKIQLSYDNWNHDAILKAILPKDFGGSVSSFSNIGHIIHLNLKPHLMDFKYVIGEVLMDKLSYVKTVVNKVQTIENEYRNFHMEILAGEPNFQVKVKENGFYYAFDFSKVFWNPRLVSEHIEIVNKLNPGDYVFDVFAGVGPFSIPAAKKRCKVYANDLNPDSYYWLLHNAKLNKVDMHIKAFNLDGRIFICNILKESLFEIWSNANFNKSIHIIMNLPALSLEFLDAFKGLLSKYKFEHIHKMPIIYCYFFLKKDENVQTVINKYFDSVYHKNLEITQVRFVAPNKKMMRLTYHLPKTILLSDETNNCIEPPAKKIKVESC